MRITIVTHKFIKGDGHGRVNYELAKAALQHGYQVTTVASEVASDLQAHQKACWVPMSSHGLPTQLGRNLMFARQSAAWLRSHRQERDLLHVNGYITDEASDVNTSHFVHGAWLRSPIHTSRQHRNTYGLYQWVFTALNAVWERQAYLRALRVVAVSERVKDELVGVGIPAAKIQVILNGVDLREFRPGTEERSGLGLPIGVPLGLFVGDLRTPRKNLDSVLAALAMTPGVHLAVVGRTDDSPFPEMAQRLGLGERAHFLGYRRDVAQLMRAADIFVFPSRYEACSLVLLEALASGLPIITARTAGGAEVVTPECGVVLPDANDIAALAQAICAMFDSVSTRSAMGQAAREIAERHSWTSMAEKYFELYRKELAETGR